ncbi:MAG: inorganic phosphate transporter [Chlamydiota bacterium]
MIALVKLFGGLFLGWGIGANNAANMFGTAVGTGAVKYRTAVGCVAAFVLIGSFLEGYKLYDGYKFDKSGEFKVSFSQAAVATTAAAVSIMFQTYLGIPTSTTQNAIGGVMGISILSMGMGGISWMKLLYWLVSWIILPVAAAAIAYAGVRGIGWIIQRTVKDMPHLNTVYKLCLLVFGCYGAYAMGANNVVVTTGPFYHAGFFGDPTHAHAVFAATLGGLAMAVGALTYGGNVIRTVGKDITALDPFSALIAVLTHSLVVHFFTQLAIPVSSSQAIVGAVAGVGLVRGVNTVNSKKLWAIFSAWFLSPVVAALLAMGIAFALGIR